MLGEEPERLIGHQGLSCGLVLDGRSNPCDVSPLIKGPAFIHFSLVFAAFYTFVPNSISSRLDGGDSRPRTATALRSQPSPTLDDAVSGDHGERGGGASGCQPISAPRCDHLTVLRSGRTRYFRVLRRRHAVMVLKTCNKVMEGAPSPIEMAMESYREADVGGPHRDGGGKLRVP